MKPAINQLSMDNATTIEKNINNPIIHKWSGKNYKGCLQLKQNNCIIQKLLENRWMKVLLTGVDPSNETLALEKDKFPAMNDPPLWKTFWGLRPSAGHLWTEESVVATHILSSCNANCRIGCSPVQSNRLSLVAKSVKYNWGHTQN